MEVMSAEALLGGHKDRFDASMRALQGGKKAGPREMARIREREVRALVLSPFCLPRSCWAFLSARSHSERLALVAERAIPRN